MMGSIIDATTDQAGDQQVGFVKKSHTLIDRPKHSGG
jgi:hypothetical protein